MFGVGVDLAGGVGEEGLEVFVCGDGVGFVVYNFPTVGEAVGEVDGAASDAG